MSAFRDARRPTIELVGLLGCEVIPGKRSDRIAMAIALEPALMADGVSPENVYEALSELGGIERAIKKIREPSAGP